MKIQGTQWFLGMLGLLTVMGITRTGGEWGFQIEEFQESPGLFYVDRGAVNLYSHLWETLVYVNLEEEKIEIDSLRSYISYVDKLCNC